MKTSFNFKTRSEAQNRVNELYARKTDLEEKKITLKNDLSQAMARGLDTSGIIAQIAAVDTELENLPAAIEIINKEVHRLQKAEDLKSAETVAADLKDAFKKNVLPQIEEQLFKCFQWRQEQRIRFVKSGLPYDDDPFRAAKTDMRSIVHTLAEQAERSMKPGKKTEPVTVDPEPSPKFGRNVKVSRTGAPVERIDGTSDSGDVPGRAESSHGLGLRTIQVPGPRY